MSFSVWDHASNRAVSHSISDVLEETVGSAIAKAGNELNIHPDVIHVVSVTARNGIHAGIDSAIGYHIRGREFQSWDLAISFITKQFQALIKNELDPHRHHFITPQSNRDDADNRWNQIVSFTASESVALLKAKYSPRPPQRPGQ